MGEDEWREGEGITQGEEVEEQLLDSGEAPGGELRQVAHRGIQERRVHGSGRGRGGRDERERPREEDDRGDEGHRQRG